METKDVYYSVEWWGEASWGEYFTDRKRFDYESEALSFIANNLKNDPRICEAYYTTHKTIVFKRGG